MFNQIKGLLQFLPPLKWWVSLQLFYEESLNGKSMLRELKEKMIEYYNRHGVDTNEYQFKKELYARLLLSDYYVIPFFCIQSKCTHNSEKSMYGTCHEYREMSINNILGALLIHENVYIEKFGEPIELDIDDMIEDLIQLFETTKLKKYED